MTETQQILERLQSCEATLDAQRGYIKALEYSVRAMIAAQEHPEKIETWWSHLLPEIADTHASMESAMFTAAFQQCLATLSQQITDAAQLKRST